MFQLLCTRVNAASTLTHHAPSKGSVATRRHGSCDPICYIKPRLWLWLGNDRICGRGARLGLPVSFQTARGRNDAEIVWRCQVERERGRGGKEGGEEGGLEAGQKASISTWSLSDSLQLRCVTTPHKPAKAKSCYCCYPSIPAKSGTMLPGNSLAHKRCHKPAACCLKENSPTNTTHTVPGNVCDFSPCLFLLVLLLNWKITWEKSNGTVYCRLLTVIK